MNNLASILIKKLKLINRLKWDCCAISCPEAHQDMGLKSTHNAEVGGSSPPIATISSFHTVLHHPKIP